jgi:hypothetical protein
MTRHLSIFPLTIIPLLIYLIVSFSYGALAGHPNVWDEELVTFNLMSGGKFTILMEHFILIIGLVCLFFEIWKATRLTNQEAYEQVTSMIVFIVYLVLFITVAKCSHAVFFLLMIISLIDVVAGFLVSLRAARRSLAVDNEFNN